MATARKLGNKEVKISIEGRNWKNKRTKERRKERKKGASAYKQGQEMSNEKCKSLQIDTAFSSKFGRSGWDETVNLVECNRPIAHYTFEPI